MSLSVRWSRLIGPNTGTKRETRSEMVSKCISILFGQLLRSSLVNNRTQAKVAEELGMQEYAITNDKTKRPVALRTKNLADLLECESYRGRFYITLQIKFDTSHCYDILTKETSFLF